MRGLWLLLTLIALGAGAAVVAFGHRAAAGTQPTAPLPAAGPAAAGERAEPIAERVDGRFHGLPTPAVDRAALPDAAREPRSAVLEVLVQLDDDRPGERAQRFVPGLEVSVHGPAGAAGPALDLSATTDAEGIARFEVPAGDGRRVAVCCVGAAATDVTLDAARPLRVVLHFSARVVVRGAVVDAAARGIAGADLVLLPWNDAADPLPRLRRVGRSGADGTFALALPDGGRLGALHDAYAPSAMYALRASSDPVPAPSFVQLALVSAPAQIEGRVVDARGRTVASAELEFRSEAEPPAGAVLAAPPMRTATTAAGWFAVGRLRPGPIVGVVRATGHGSAAARFELLPGQVRFTEFVLPPACEVHGRVEDERGLPVPGCRVLAHGLEAFAAASATTAPDGTFALTGLPPGTVQLTARDGGASWLAPTRADEVELDLAPGQVTHWRATLRARRTGSSVRGLVVDAAGVGLAGWRVHVRGRDGTHRTRTDGDGAFEVRPPGAGTVDVFVYAPETRVDAFADASRRDVDPGAGAIRILVDGGGAGAVTGRVVTAAMQAVPATVTCRHHEREELVRVRAGDDGTVCLERVPPGTIDLHFEHAGHTMQSRTALRVRSGATIDVGTIVLARAATLYGEVTGPDGRPPEQLEVALLTAARRIPGDYAAGIYRFDTAPAGRHVLQVQGRAVAARNFVVELEAGVERRQDMRLGRGLERRVVVAVPAAAGDVVSLALREPGAAHIWFAATAIERAGAGPSEVDFAVHMAPGVYEAIAWTDGGWEGRAEIRFADGIDGAARLSLQRR